MGPQKVLHESSDSDAEELPRFSFLQPQNSSCSLQGDNVILLESSGSESSRPSSPVVKSPHSVQRGLSRASNCGESPCGAQQGLTSASACDQDITMISSDSDEEEVIVSLAERLKSRFTAIEPPHRDSAFPVCTAGSSTFRPEHNFVPATKGRLESTCRLLGATGLQPPNSDHDAVPRPPKKMPFQRSPVYQSHSLSLGAKSQEVGSDIGPPQKKAKRGVEEIEAGRQDALRKMREREKLRAGKEAQEQEKARRKMLAEALRAQRPEECMKRLQVLIDPALLQVEGGGLLLSALQTMECSCLVDSRPVPSSISWRRAAQNLQVEESVWMDDPSLLVLVPQKDFIAMIQRSRKECHNDDEGKLETLRSFTASLLERSDGKCAALVVMEMEKYFKDQKTQSQKQLRQAVLSGAAAAKRRNKKTDKDVLPMLSRVDVEEALVDVQLHTGVQVRFLETWKEFGEFASMFTKAVAEAPFKRKRDNTSFSFYLENDWSGGVRVDRCGRGLLQVWKRQFQQLNRVSVEIANAVVTVYPSPQLLAQAYRRCASRSVQQDLLSDILVRRGEGVTSTSRRVGPELSKRIYLQQTSLNPELSLEVTA